ncbi:MAG: ABC transporter ATP-binding protein [Nesterenkonia sp.]|nr:ABC transporter ATP-binding protein [Nesterenkonia sp.]
MGLRRRQSASRSTSAIRTASIAPRDSGSPARTLREALARLDIYLEGIRTRWVAGLVSAVLALVIPQVLQLLVDALLDPGAAATAVWIAGGVMLVMGLAQAGLIYLRRFFILPPASGAETAMRNRLFDVLQDLPASFHASWGAGQLQSRAISDLNVIRRWFAFGSVMLVTSAVSLLVGFGLMLSLSPLLTSVFVVAAVPLLLAGPRFRREYMRLSRSAQDQAGEVATAVEESVHGIRVLKAFGREEYALGSFVGQAQSLRGREIAKAHTLARFQLIMIGLPELALGVCLLIGLQQVAAGGDLTVGALAAFFATAAVLKAPLEGLGMLLGMTFMSKTAIDRHIDVVDLEPEIVSPEEPRTAPERGTVEFDDVVFRFPGSSEESAPLLRGLSLTVERGETLALVSETGGGTSTLLNLVPRLYDVVSGSVRVDGIDVRDFDLADLRSRVAVAFEDPTLFSASVRENVLLGTGWGREPDDPRHPPRGTDTDEEYEARLREALRVADAEFVAALPAREDTAVGEEGLSLSGGQRQRLALARAIAARPSVLLLDDPLSALDVRTEERVTGRLREVLTDTTTLLVAHRPSTVALADRVAMLHEGRIVDVGTHAELLARSETYRAVMSPEPTAESLWGGDRL